MCSQLQLGRGPLWDSHKYSNDKGLDMKKDLIKTCNLIHGTNLKIAAPPSVYSKIVKGDEWLVADDCLHTGLN
jgi:hypothetical protein